MGIRNLHPTRISRWDFLLAFSTVYWPSDGQRLSSWLVNHSLWFRLIRPAMKPSFLGGVTYRGGRLTRHKCQADLTQTMDYDKFMNRWITRRHEVIRRRYLRFNKCWWNFDAGKKKGSAIYPYYFGGDQIWCKCLWDVYGKIWGNCTEWFIVWVGCHIIMTPVVANLGPNFWQDNRTRPGRISGGVKKIYPRTEFFMFHVSSFLDRWSECGFFC